MSSPAQGQIPGSAEQQHRLLMENVKDYAIFLLDPGGRIATWNVGAERILGYADTEAIGQPFSLIFTSLDNANGQAERELSQAKEHGRSEDERWHLRKDGGQFWASGVVTALRDGGGALVGFAKVLRDITERKRHEAELADAGRRKDEFLAMLAHELRNPLAPMAYSIRQLLMPEQATPVQRVALEVVDRQLRHLIRLVDDLLDVARITQGRIKLQKERLELGALVQHVLEGVRPSLDTRQIELIATLPPGAIWLEADPVRLEQVLGNLLNNAVKYSQAGGKIWLTVERENGQAVLRVRDSGIGMLEELLPRVFELFVQADRSLDRSQGGLGIGLSLVQSLVQAHGGTVSAASPGIGQGSEFTVRLPLLPELTRPEPGLSPFEAKRYCRPLRLLVVDDHLDTQQSVALVMRAHGHHVSTAGNGPEALKLLMEDRPEAVLMDIGLPGGMDGYEVARRIRSLTSLPQPVLIAITGYGQDADRNRAQQAGFDQHFVKPVDLANLQLFLAGLILEFPRNG